MTRVEDLADMTLIARGIMDPWVDVITGGTLWWPNFLLKVFYVNKDVYREDN